MGFPLALLQVDAELLHSHEVAIQVPVVENSLDVNSVALEETHSQDPHLVVGSLEYEREHWVPRDLPALQPMSHHWHYDAPKHGNSSYDKIDAVGIEIVEQAATSLEVEVEGAVLIDHQTGLHRERRIAYIGTSVHLVHKLLDVANQTRHITFFGSRQVGLDAHCVEVVDAIGYCPWIC